MTDRKTNSTDQELLHLRAENAQLKQLVGERPITDPSDFNCLNFCSVLPHAIRSAGLGLWSVDLRNLMVNWSLEMCAILGIHRDTFLSDNQYTFSIDRFMEYIHPEDRQRTGQEVENCIAEKKKFNTVFRMLHDAGHFKWVHSIGETTYDKDGTPLHMTGFVWDVSEHKDVEEHLRELSITDALTGLHNRRRLVEVLEQELRYCKRFGTEVSVISIDIDHFKSINDTYGHEMGDRMLKALSKLMTQTFRDVDYLFRWGGEEFIAVLPNIGVKDAKLACERLLEAFKRINIDGAQTTISAGIASSAQINPDDDYNELLEISDQALYGAKRAGRNRIHCAIRQTEAAEL
jgi:diguanylate cyclase (GGDEF)-like protein/PAS domain S-box-containing protein